MRVLAVPVAPALLVTPRVVAPVPVADLAVVPDVDAHPDVIGIGDRAEAGEGVTVNDRDGAADRARVRDGADRGQAVVHGERRVQVGDLAGLRGVAHPGDGGRGELHAEDAELDRGRVLVRRDRGLDVHERLDAGGERPVPGGAVRVGDRRGGDSREGGPSGQAQRRGGGPGREHKLASDHGGRCLLVSSSEVTLQTRQEARRITGVPSRAVDWYTQDRRRACGGSAGSPPAQ